MLENDLEDLQGWTEPLEDSARIWTEFMSRAKDLILDEREGMDEEARESRMPQMVYLHQASSHITRSRMYLDMLQAGGLSIDRLSNMAREILKPYLSYVNANIILSNELNVGFHDWTDYSPFYRKKFVSVGKLEVENQEAKAEAVHKLFTLSFPDFAIRDVKQFMSIVTDKRIGELRTKIQEAVDGKVQFDGDFARETLFEVLKLERKVAHYRHVTFFLTLPLHFIPLVGAAVHKVAEEAVSAAMDRKLKNSHRWFYLLSDTSKTGSH